MVHKEGNGDLWQGQLGPKEVAVDCVAAGKASLRNGLELSTNPTYFLPYPVWVKDRRIGNGTARAPVRRNSANQLTGRGQSFPLAYLTDRAARQRLRAHSGRRIEGGGIQGTNPEPVWDLIPIVRPGKGGLSARMAMPFGPMHRPHAMSGRHWSQWVTAERAGEVSGRGIGGASFSLPP